jgi:alpha-mannosidase
MFENVLNHFFLQFFTVLHSSRSGVSNLWRAGRMWSSQPFYAACHMIWELANARRTKNFLLLRNIDINTYAVSEYKGKQSQTSSLTKQEFCRCRRNPLKSFCCATIHCSIDQAIWNLTKHYENYCSINNWSFIKLTMTWSQNCLKTNKQYNL